MSIESSLEMPLGDEFAQQTAVVKIDHVAAALDRLPWQFSDQPNVIAVLTALITPMQTLEQAIADIILNRSINVATGITLTMLGDLVGQPRLDVTDDEVYRRVVRARVAVNKSNGRVEDLIGVTKLILNDISADIFIDRQFVAAYVAHITGITVDDTTANQLVDLLKEATLAGVDTIVETSYVADSDTWFTAIAAFANGAMSIGNTSIVVASTAGFPASGSLIIDQGLAVQETVTYSGITSTSFTGVSALAHNHVTLTEVVLATGPGKGMGDTSDGTVGGELISARDKHYP